VIQRLLTHIAWPIRALWIIVGLFQQSFTPGIWILWVIAALASWILHPISLTAIRLSSPLVFIFLIAQLPAEEFEVLPVAIATASLVALLLIYTSDFGVTQVQAGAYGNERRFLLRIPVSLALPSLLTWAVLAALFVVSDNLLGNELWVGGSIVSVCTAAAIWKFTPQLHRLSLRWLVRVPAGWVIHDGVLLAENLLLRTHNITTLQLAPADTEAIDLSGITYGIPLEISLREMTDVRLTPLLSKVTKTVDALHVKQMMVAPSQVQRVLSI
jgi:hypothetical protein